MGVDAGLNRSKAIRWLRTAIANWPAKAPTAGKRKGGRPGGLERASRKRRLIKGHFAN